LRAGAAGHRRWWRVRRILRLIAHCGCPGYCP
jgi:hypothetical protein